MSVSQSLGVVRREVLTDKPARAESLDVYKVIRRGEIAFNKMSIRAGALGVAAEDGLVTYHYEVMRPLPGHDARYLVYLMKSEWFIAELVRRERGIGAGEQANVRTTEVPFRVLKMIDCWLPALTEQRAIADFLDAETARIDALIEKQTKLIELLRERSKAQAWRLTLGQDLGRSHGDAWYGRPPSGWLLDKLGRHSRIVNGSTPSRENLAYWEGGDFAWLNSSHANADVVQDADQWVTPLALKECHLPILQPGTVLVGITGQGKTRGSVAQLDCVATINQHLAAVVPDARYWHFRYLTHLLRAAYEELRFMSDEAGSTKGALTCAALHAFVVPRPPLAEQRSLAAQMDAETAIDTLIAKAERMIELSRERRSALITAAVTGQIDVTKEA